MANGAWDLRAILAQNIKSARKNLNFTQARLAEFAGVSLACIVDIEGCRSWVSDRTLACIGRALNLEAWQLLLPQSLGGVPDPARETSLQRRVMALVAGKQSEMREVMDALSHDILRTFSEPDAPPQAEG